MTSAFSWQNSLAIVLLHFVLHCQTCLLLQVFLDFYFCFQSPVMKRTYFLGVSSRRSCRSSQNYSTSASSALFTGQGIDLDYRDIEWFALETKRDHSVVFEIASKYSILDFLVDYNGYSISSKGFLLTVVDTMVI